MLHRIHGYELETANDHIGRQIARGRPYEPWVLAVLRVLTGRNGLLVDVGAHVGNHTVNLAMAGARVVAIEPYPRNFTMLTRNVQRNKLQSRVKLHQVACGAKASTGSVTLPDDDNTGSAVVSGGTGGSGGSGKVRIIALDDLHLAPDAIKIDVEGGETAVLEGALETLRQSRPAIICELHTGSLMSTLGPLGYRRVGSSLAASPTYLYMARTAHLKAVPVALLGSTRFRAQRMRKRVVTVRRS